MQAAPAAPRAAFCAPRPGSLDRVIADWRDAWFAAENHCPHTGDRVLGRGIVGDQGGRPKVACPQHKKTFDLETGEGLSDPDLRIASFPAKVEQGKVYVLLPPPSALARALGEGTSDGCSERTCGTPCGG